MKKTGNRPAMPPGLKPPREAEDPELTWLRSLNRLAAELDECAASLHPSVWREQLGPMNARWRALARAGSPLAQDARRRERRTPLKITNRKGLPAPLVAAAADVREPRPGHISVTELINPPQIRSLSLRHWDEIEEDAHDRMFAVLGRLMHVLLHEYADGAELISEETLTTQVQGMIVTGTPDLLHKDGTLSDYKLVGMRTTAYGIKGEWVEQLNLYAELLRRRGYRIERLEIVAVYRDWMTRQTGKANYPQTQSETFPVPLWEEGEAARFLEERVRLHRAAEAGDVPECTDAERWHRPARSKGGRGSNPRCESYCRVASFCPQRARMLAAEAA
jgi:hypothetical protein